MGGLINCNSVQDQSELNLILLTKTERRMQRLVLFLFMLCCLLAAVYGKGGRGGGGGRSGGSRSSSRSGSSSGSRSGSRSYSRTSYKTKPTSTLKKAAVVGLGVYGTYKLAKATSKFGKKKLKFKNGADIDFDEWDGWRQESGLLCRNTTDCNWLDVDLRCDNYEASVRASIVQALTGNWFGDKNLIVGECQCQRESQVWNEDELECFVPSLSGLVIFFIVVGVLLAVIGCFCLCLRCAS